MQFGSPIFTESVSATTLTPSVVPGSRRVDEAGNQYVYGYNAAANSVIDLGVPVVLTSTTSGYSFTPTNAASQVGWVAAVNHHATIATGAYGWLMVKGQCRISPDASAVSMNAGDNLAIGVDGGFVVAPATMATAVRVGFATGSIVTGYGVNSGGAMGKGWIRTILG
jgi:hypothetical protein